jgi:hypothetical protein
MLSIEYYSAKICPIVKVRMEKAETKADIEAIYKEVLKDVGQANGASP